VSPSAKSTIRAQRLQLPRCNTDTIGPLSTCPLKVYWAGSSVWGSPTGTVVPSGKTKPSLSSVVLLGKLAVSSVAENVLPSVQAVVQPVSLTVTLPYGGGGTLQDARHWAST